MNSMCETRIDMMLSQACNGCMRVCVHVCVWCVCVCVCVCVCSAPHSPPHLITHKHTHTNTQTYTQTHRHAHPQAWRYSSAEMTHRILNDSLSHTHRQIYHLCDALWRQSK